jgi:hypothetical protein
MKTAHHFASYLSLVECPHGVAIQVFEEGNETRKANAVVFVTARQLAGLRRQKPIKLKKELLAVKKSKRS